MDLATQRLASFPDRILLFCPAPKRMLVWWGLGVVIPVATAFRVWLQQRRPSGPTPLDRAQARLACLPLLALVCRGCQVLQPTLSANLLYYGAPAVMAWALCAGYAPRPALPTAAEHHRRDWLAVLLCATVLYGCAGWAFTRVVGEHSGDEGHFLIQAQSLYRDHDLDLRNDFGNPAVGNLLALHISPHSRGGHWYSLHTPGLAFLLAPTVPFGLALRHLVLGLIAGLGLAGFYLLCRLLDADRLTSVILLVLLGGSTLWGIYACRALPEVLGATLTIYGLLAIARQSERPWHSLGGLLLVMAALPWAYVRFAPVALALGAGYGLLDLFAARPWRVSLLRLALLALGAAAGLGLFLTAQAQLFDTPLGLAHRADVLTFAPRFAWQALSSSRGILLAFPLFACALPALLTLLPRRATWRYGLPATLVFLSIFLTWCSSNHFTGDACLPGRFFVVIVPVVTAALAIWLPHANGAFRGLTFYLGLLSLCMLAAEIAVLPALQKDFTDPFLVGVLHPIFQGVRPILSPPFASAWQWPALLLYATATLLLWPKMPRLIQAGCLGALLIGVLVSVGPAPSGADPQRNPQQVGEQLWPLDLERVQFSAWGATADPQPLWAGIAPRSWATPAITGRGEQSLFSPAALGPGWHVLRLTAQLEGAAAAELIISAGAPPYLTRHYPPHSRIRDVFTFQSAGGGSLAVYVRLDRPEGRWQAGTVECSNYSPALLRQANLLLPAALP